MVGRASVSGPDMWPQFKVSVPDPVLGEVYSGKAGMTPEQSLVEFISSSASFHGVKKQPLRSLEWDLLKVFTNNVMPANAAAWYMAKRKFYMNQSFDQQLLPFLLKKFPDKFKIVGSNVIFLEVYNKDVAGQKLQYLVQYGLDAYFSHKADEYGVYFFDPVYYENTEPFHESLRQCTNNKAGRGKLVNKYFRQEGTRQKFTYKQHSSVLVSICKEPGVKVITNTTGVIVSMINSQYGFIKFGSAETAMFSSKSLYRDGWQFTGDPLSLPAMKFDGYQIPDSKGDKGGRSYTWYAVLVWCGRRPSPKFCSTAEDLNSTPVFREGRLSTVSSQGEGRKLRQPSSSMMVGQVVEIRRNGAVLRVREDCPEKVFVPGWKRQLASKPGVTWLSTVTGELIGMGDLVAYYVDNEVRPGYSAVGKNVMVLKERDEVEAANRKVRRRRRKSTELSAGAKYKEGEYSEGKISEDDGSLSEISVSEGELEWLDKDLASLIAMEDPAATTLKLLNDVHNQLQGVKKSGKRKYKIKGDKPGYTAMAIQENSFWRMKRMMVSLESGYRSESDSDYHPGDSVEEIRRPRGSLGDITTTDSCLNNSHSSTQVDDGKRKKNLTIGSSVSVTSAGTEETPKGRTLPFWVRAISLPEKYDKETEKFVPLDSDYIEERDPDYMLPETDNEDISEEEDFEAVDLLITEAEVELSVDLLEGKHRHDPLKTGSPVKGSMTPSKEGEDEFPEVILVDDSEGEKIPPSPVPVWAKEIGLIEQSEDYDSDDDPEFVPPVVIVDTDVDYDEYSDDDQEEMLKEVATLLSESTQPLEIPSTYVPIWVKVDSPKERINEAKNHIEGSLGESVDKTETSGKDTDSDKMVEKVAGGRIEEAKPKRRRKMYGKKVDHADDRAVSNGQVKQQLPEDSGDCFKAEEVAHSNGQAKQHLPEDSGDCFKAEEVDHEDETKKNLVEEAV